MLRLGTRAARDIWWFFLFVLITQGLLVGYNILRNSADEALVTHTLQVLNSINQLQSACLDAETGARGFVVTGDDAMLEPFHTAQAEIPQALRQLRELTADRPDQKVKLDAIEARINQRRELLQKLIQSRRKSPQDTAAISRLIHDSKTVMDDIRAQVESMRSEERRLLDLRERSTKRSFTLSIFTTIIGGTLSIGMLVLARWLMQREYLTRRSSEAALRLSDERFGTLAETMPQIVWVARPDGRFEFFNKHWYEYTGMSDKAEQVDFESVVHPGDADRMRERWQTCLLTGEPYEIEYRLRRHDGHFRWYLRRALPMRDSAGEILHWFGTCTDIENQRQLQIELEERVLERTAELQSAVSELSDEIERREKATQQLRLSSAELQRSNKELEQFAYVASHDLQEPLRKIQAFSDRLKTRYAESIAGQGKDYIDRMQIAAGRMRQLINDLLTFSRVSTQPWSFEPVDLNRIVHDVVDDFDETVSEMAAEIEVGSLPTVNGDATQMRQLFQNLLSNALKFRKPGEPPRVMIRGKEIDHAFGAKSNGIHSKAAHITVTDHGIGFDPTYADRIFQVFQRLHGRDQYQGTGIGLAVVRKIVERHGGTITAHGRPDDGATFEIVLPIHPPVPQQIASAPAENSKESILT